MFSSFLSNELSLDRPNLSKIELDYTTDNYDNFISDSPSLLNFEASTPSTSNNLSTIFKEPKSYKEAINSIYKDQWLESIKTKLDSLTKNKT